MSPQSSESIAKARHDGVMKKPKQTTNPKRALGNNITQSNCNHELSQPMNGTEQMIAMRRQGQGPM